MGLYDALGMLRGQWDEVAVLLGVDLSRRLSQLVDDLASFPPGSLQADHLAEETAGLILTLPRGHPVREALLARSTRLSTGVLRSTPPLDVGSLPAPEIRARLSAAESVSPRHVQHAGQDPDNPALINLVAPSGLRQLPAFQFDQAGRPRLVVMEINTELGSHRDPWGVADWWLGQNTLLGGVPSELIGVVPDSVLVAAARDVAAED